MKRFVLFAFAALVSVGAWAHQYEATVNGVKWYYNLISDGNGGYNAEITYRGSYYDSYSNEYSRSLPIPSTLGGYKVTTIGDEAFSGCSSLKSVTIPNSVTTIGDGAFSGCSSLTSVTIPNSVTTIGWHAFRDCSSLTSIKIPNSVTTIGDYAFYNCSSLTSVTIPESVTRIGDRVFCGCSSLVEIDVANENSSYCSKDGILYTKNMATLEACPNAKTSVTIPDGVTEIGDDAFFGCSSLTSITIPNSVTTIGGYAFVDCSSLKSVTIPDSVTTIGDGAFSGCSSLTSVTIPNSVTAIGQSAFSRCSSLKSVTIPNSVTSIEAWAFYGCSSLTSVTIPNSVTRIGLEAFSGCSSLKSVTIPESVTTIGLEAFYGCSSLNMVHVDIGETSRVKELLRGKGVAVDSLTFAEDGVQDTPNPPAWTNSIALDLEHNYAFETGVWNGWNYAEMEDGRSHDYSGWNENPWSFEYGWDSLQNIAIPVNGCGKNKIKPVLYFGSAGADELSADVLSEDEMAAKFGIGKYAFEYDEWDEEYVYENSRTRISVEFPESAWPYLKKNPDRQWIVVSLKNIKNGKDGFFSPKTFCVGIFGTDQVTPLITVQPHDELPSTTGFTPSAVFGVKIAMSVGAGSDDVPSFDPFFHLWSPGNDAQNEVPYIFDTDDDDESFGKVTITAPAAGELYLKLGRLWYPGDWDIYDDPRTMSFKGKVLSESPRIVSDNGWGYERSCWVILKTKASGPIEISNYYEKLYVDGIWFRPDTLAETDVIATSAAYREDACLANDRYKVNYRCFVTGMGVTKLGNRATLVCHPNEGEVFDHWEFVNCTAPADATLMNTTLTFTPTREMYDEIDCGDEGLRVVIVRPVFKPQQTIIGIPTTVGAATIKGSGTFLAGAETYLKVEPAEGCTFIRWMDGVTDNPRRVVADDSKVTAIYYAITEGDPPANKLADKYGPFVPGKEIEPIDFSFAEGWKVSGLPAGLKYNAKTGFVTGKPTKSGEFTVKLTRASDKTVETTVFEVMSAAEDKAAIKITIAGDMKPQEMVDEFDEIELPIGVKVNWPLKATALSATTVKAAKLPAGLKLVQDKVTKEYSIQGVPTKLAYTAASITVTTAGKNSRVFTMPITTMPMSTWAVGIFNGGLISAEGKELGLVTLTTTAAGKISGKILKRGQTWAVSATGFDAYDVDGYHATLTAKSGKLTPETYEIVIDKEGVFGANADGEQIEAYWNPWKTPQGKARGKDLAAMYKPGLPTEGLELPEGMTSLTLKLSASGAIKATGFFDGGYKATSSTVLVSTDSGYLVYLYFAPNAKKGFAAGEAFTVRLDL